MEHQVSIDQPPPRVRVEAATPGGQTETRIVYRWGSVPRLLLGLLLLVEGCICLWGDESGTVGCLGLCGFVAGAVISLYALFGRLVVKLCPKKGVYSSLFGWKEFPISPRTQVRRIKHTKFKDGRETHWFEIQVTDGSSGCVRFGRFFPGNVQDYICICIAHLSAGSELVPARGSIWRSNLAHPWWFSFFAALLAIVLVFSTSWEGRIVVRNGYAGWLHIAIWFFCCLFWVLSEEREGESVDEEKLQNENAGEQPENAPTNIDEITERAAAGDVAGVEAAACEPPVAEPDDVQMPRNHDTHGRRCAVCGRDSNRFRRVFLSLHRTIGDSHDGEVWNFRGGFGVHMCSRCRRMEKIKPMLALAMCLVGCLVLLRLVFAISAKTDWHPLWYFSLGVLAIGIPVIACLLYDMSVRFAWLHKSTDPRFSLLQAYGYEIEAEFCLREVEDQDNVKGLFGSRRRDDTKRFRKDVQRQLYATHYSWGYDWVEHQIYEWLGDFGQAGDAGNVSSGLEAAKCLARQSEQTKNAIGKRAASGLSGFSEERVCLGVVVLAVSAVLVIDLVVGVVNLLAWVRKKWEVDSSGTACVLLVMGVVTWGVHAFIKERRK